MTSALQISGIMSIFGQSSEEVSNTRNIDKVGFSKSFLSEGIRQKRVPLTFLVINRLFSGIRIFLCRMYIGILGKTKNLYPMKKVIILCAAALMLQSCATIWNGKITDCQKSQRKNEVNRQINVGWIACDIIFGIIPLFVDYKTGAIYEKQAPDCKPKQ